MPQKVIFKVVATCVLPQWLITYKSNKPFKRRIWLDNWNRAKHMICTYMTQELKTIIPENPDEIGTLPQQGSSFWSLGAFLLYLQWWWSNCSRVPKHTQYGSWVLALQVKLSNSFHCLAYKHHHKQPEKGEEFIGYLWACHWLTQIC